MADRELLTRLEAAGGLGSLDRLAELWEREALLLHVKALKAAGHAIVVDEVRENGEAQGKLYVTHYLSCTRCSDAKS